MYIQYCEPYKKIGKKCVHRSTLPVFPARVNSGMTAEWKSGKVNSGMTAEWKSGQV